MMKASRVNWLSLQNCGNYRRKDIVGRVRFVAVRQLNILIRNGVIVIVLSTTKKVAIFLTGSRLTTLRYCHRVTKSRGIGGLTLKVPNAREIDKRTEQVKIRARVDRFAKLGSWRHDSDAINVFLADLRELSAVQ